MECRKFFSKQQKEVKSFLFSLCFHTLLLLIMACIFYTDYSTIAIPITISFTNNEIPLIENLESMGSIELPDLEEASASVATKTADESPDVTPIEQTESEILIEEVFFSHIEQETNSDLINIDPLELYSEIKTNNSIKNNPKLRSSKDENSETNNLISELVSSFAQNTNTTSNFIAGGVAGVGSDSMGSGTIEKRLYLAGAKTGDIQISLAWNTTDDIDLWVGYSPDKSRVDYINFMNRRSSLSGGMLDIDMNAQMFDLRNNPIENVFWPKNQAPRGFYDIRVHFFRSWTGNNIIPVLVRIKILEEIKEYKVTPRLGNAPESVIIFSFPPTLNR